MNLVAMYTDQRKVINRIKVSERFAKGFVAGTSGIVATFGGTVVGELQSISYSSVREISPICVRIPDQPVGIVVHRDIKFDREWPMPPRQQ